jgi:predicted small integral membrane protein
MSENSESSETRSPEEEKAHLESLFKAWDSRKGDGLVLDADEAAEMAAARKAWGLDPSRVWRTIALLMVGLCVWVMTLIWSDVSYWAQGDDSLQDVGHVGEMWTGGATTLEAPSNHYVSMDGLFVTLESEGERDSAKIGEREVVSRFFFCPLYDVAVRTQQPFPDKPVRQQWSLEIDGRFASLLEERRAFPVDLTVTVAVQGRLMRASDVPYWHSDPLIYYQQVSGISAREMWLMIDGSKPSDHRSSALFFGVALLIALVGSAYVGRSWLQARAA